MSHFAVARRRASVYTGRMKNPLISMVWAGWLLGTAAWNGACVSSELDDLADDEAASFLGDASKADGLLAEEGSLTADAILRVANTLSLAELKSEVHLSATTAKRIATYRAGADGALGTADDRFIASLSELDAIPYVGPVAYQKLEAYALGLADRYVQPFACVGEAMTMSQFIAYLPAGQSERAMKGGVFQRRKRMCSADGCGAWSATESHVYNSIVADNYGAPNSDQVWWNRPLTYQTAFYDADGERPRVRLKIGDTWETNADYSHTSRYGHGVEGTTIAEMARRWPLDAVNIGTGRYVPNEVWLPLGGTMTTNCVAFKHTFKLNPLGTALADANATTWQEREVGLRYNF